VRVRNLQRGCGAWVCLGLSSKVHLESFDRGLKPDVTYGIIVGEGEVLRVMLPISWMGFDGAPDAAGERLAAGGG